MTKAMGKGYWKLDRILRYLLESDQRSDETIMPLRQQMEGAFAASQIVRALRDKEGKK